MTKPRSLILDLFGDYLRYVGSEVRAADLVDLLFALGVEPATTRVTLSRLRQEGWFTTRREGRETIYRLTDGLLEILDEGRDRIFAPYRVEWDGWWTQVVFELPESDRTVREQLKKRLAWLGFGALSTSTWLSPRPIRQRAEALSVEFPTVRIDVLSSRTDDLSHDRRLVEQCWDLPALDADYRDFMCAHSGLAETAAQLTGAAALIARVELTSTFRHFPFRDPSLPESLRPHDWSGAEAHGLFLALHDQLASAASDYVGSVVGEDVGALAGSENI